MINCILFSKNRAMQVDATLLSFFLHCQDPENAAITVLYACSTEQHYRQYIQLAQEWSDHKQIIFIKEKAFRQDFLKILSSFQNNLFTLFMQSNHRVVRVIQRFIPFPHSDAKIMFLVDDTIFTSAFRLSEICNAMTSNPDSLGFSLRLGRNIKYSYMLDKPESQPNFDSLTENLLKFRWTDADMDFNYPLEVSSSVYRLTDVLTALKGGLFSNPNFLEGVMNVNKSRFTSTKPNILCYTSSVAFCNPVNIVQTASLENRRGDQIHYSIDELAELFDQQKRIDVTVFQNFIPDSCHVEHKLTFSVKES